LCGGDEGSLWNLGICATGAGDREAAREAWEGLGIEVEEVGSEIHTKGAGVVQVRVSERGAIVAPREGDPESFEYLWMARLGPAHGRILSPTVGNLVVDVGDVVLHDGAAAAYRVDGKRKVPRFPLMALLRRRTNHVFRFAGAQPGRGAIAALEEKLGAGSVYVHTEQVAWLCRECARGGKAGHQHEQLKPDTRIVYGKLVIEEGRLATFREALDGALGARDDLALYCPELHQALGDEARAGADQEAWTALAYT
jgi:hypothetical protein